MRHWVKRAALGIAIMAAGWCARAADEPDGRRWWSHVEVLADDAMEGRDTGSEGHRKAAEYVAREFEAIGLKPAGTDGFLQPVEFHSRAIDEARSQLVLVRDGQEQPLALGEDAVISARVDPAPVFEAPLIFAGFGLSIPEAGHDDFEGIDVEGKLVVCLRGAPTGLSGPIAAHAQFDGERSAALRRAGAIGVILIPNPRHMDAPWERLSATRALPAMVLADPALDDNRDLAVGIEFNPARADQLLAGSGHTFEEILALADAGEPLPRFEIPARLRGTVAVTRAEVTSENVVALLPGSDPTLAGEYVTFTAHLDHLGVGRPVNGDAIYNGAMDNASGVASLLDVAAILVERGVRPRRSILFAAVTAEEKGLLGSRYFAHHPPVGEGAIVANINIDMILPLHPFRALTMFGSEESDLGDEAAEMARAAGVKPLPDPFPERNVFIRSDQYSFVRRGIPALMVMVGFEKGSPEERTVIAWLSERYHAPSDDVDQPVDRRAAGEFDALVADLLERVADRDERPRWKESSPFGRLAP